MKNQIIITVGRESGSGGHAIAKKLADAMGIACYDKKKLVEGTAEISGMNKNYVKYQKDRGQRRELRDRRTLRGCSPL